MKKIAIWLLVTILLFASACSGNADKGTSLNKEQVDVWAISATEKVLLDKPKTDYLDKRKNSITLVMAKNEYESGQVIISPDANVEKYTVKVNSLVHENGNDKIDSKNIEVYVEKYLRVLNNYEGNGAPLGSYPDALVPMQAIIEYGENSIMANNNQGIYITFKTEKDQSVGVYSGNVVVDFESFTKTIPVSIEVKDVIVSDENHRRDVYLASGTYEHGELNSTQAMRDAYTEACIEYRVASCSTLAENDHSTESIKRWAEKCYYYLTGTNCSTVNIPYKVISKELVCNANMEKKGMECFDPDVLTEYILCLAEMSVKNNVELLEHVVFYNAIIDEAVDQGLVDLAYGNIRLFSITIPEVASTFANKYYLNVEYGKQIENAQTIEERTYNEILTIENVFTAYYYAGYSEFDDYVTYVPLANGMDSNGQRNLYEHQERKWWYYCNNPSYPYVSVHVDNTTVFSARMMGWMQADYNIEGTLYWGVNRYVEADFNKNYVCLEDYFEGSAQRTYHMATGEGYLFYPGGQYGLRKPIPSMRIMALRDGYEEYELIYALKERYKQNGFSANELVSSLSEQLYSGTKVSATTDDFISARKSLLNLCEIANTSAEVSIIDLIDDGNGQIECSVFSKSEITQNGQPINGEIQGQGKIYKIYKQLTDNTNDLKFEFEADGKQYVYLQKLGGKVEVYSAEEIFEDFSFSNDTAMIVDYLFDDEKGVRVDVFQTTSSYQIFKMNSSLFAKIGKNTSKIVLSVYSDYEEEVEFFVYAKYTKQAVSFSLISTKLKQGENIIELSVAYTNWTKYGSIECLRLRFGEDKVNPNRTIYFNKVTIYNK